MNIFDVTLYEVLPWPYQSLFVFIGAALGSFFNVLALRWPEYQKNKNDFESSAWLRLRGIRLRDELQPKTINLMAGRSCCPNCKAKIPIYLNIPVFSWLFLRGRSACCKCRIPFRYLAFELYGAIVFLLVAATVGPSMTGLFLGAIFLILTLIALIDLKENFIPDQLLAALFMLSYIFSASPQGIGAENAIQYHVFTLILLISVLYLIEKIKGGPGMGTSDVHLIALGASLLGSQAILMFVLLLPLILTTATLIRCKIVSPGSFSMLIGKSAVPAGPAICASIIILLAAQGFSHG